MADVKAIGMLETEGLVPLVQGADAAVKAANVNLVEWRKVGRGYVSFVLEGEVAAVRSAIEAGSEAATSVGKVFSTLVIPKPVEELQGTFQKAKR